MEISRIFYDQDVIMLERQERFDKAAEFAYQKWKDDPTDVQKLVAAGAQLWYAIYLKDVNQCCSPTHMDTDPGYPDPDMTGDRLDETLRYGEAHFADHPLFLAVFGYMIKALPPYFSDMGGDYEGFYSKGLAMIRKAFDLGNDDLFIRGIYYEAFGDEAAYRAACGQLWQNISPEEWGMSEVQQYFFRILGGDALWARGICP